MPELKIHLFGAFEVLIADQPIQHKYWQSRQVRTIFKLLILQRGRPLASTQIVEAIWPNEKQEVALQRLYIRISQLRRILEQGAVEVKIQTIEGGYLFDYKYPQPGEISSCWIDVDVFENLADQGRMLLEQNQYQAAVEVFEKARSLYRADYLIEDQYDDWSMTERERMRDRFLILLTELSEAYAQMGQYRRAIHTCQKILQADSCREAVFVRLMLFYYYAGEKNKALQTFEYCQKVLWKELGVEPDASTIELVEKIQNGSLWQQGDSPLYPPPNYEGRIYEVPFSLSNLPLVGRDREYAWIVNHWKKNPGAVFLIEGEAGIGKSRLMEAFRGYIQNLGVTVFSVKGLADLNTPYGLFLQIRQDEQNNKNQSLPNLGNLLRNEIGRVNSSTAGTDYGKTAEIIKTFLRKHSSQSVFIVDDAQWADEASLNLLAELIGNLTILLVFRSGETLIEQWLPSQFLEQQNGNALFRLSLPHLSSADIKTLITQISDSDIPGFHDFVVKKTGGNPLFILVFLQNLFESGDLYVNPDGKWVWLGKDKNEIIADLSTMIETRLKAVHLEERRILDVLAVAGGAMDMDLLHTVLEISEMSLIRLIDTLIERTYVVEPRSRNEPEVSLPHGLYTEVIYQTLPKSRKRIYHRRIAEELALIGKDKLENAALVAHHAVLGEDFNRAVKAYNDAGWYGLKVYVPQQAELYFSRALALIKNMPELDNTPLFGEILFGLAECQRLSGNYEEAMISYSRSVALLPAVLKQAAVYQAFQLNMMTGTELQNFEELAKKLEADLISDGNSWALALLYWGQAFTVLMQGKVKKTILLNRNGWRVARDLIQRGESFPPWIWQRAYTLLARMHIQWGNFSSAHKIVKCLIQNAEETGQQNNLASAKIWLGEVLLNRSEYGSAQEAFMAGLKIAEKANDPRLCGEAQLGLGRVSYEKRDFDEAAAYADHVWTVSEKNKDILRQLNALILKTRVLLSTNQKIDSNISGLNNLLLLAKYLGAQPYVVAILTILIEVYLKQGENERAAELLSEALPLAEQFGLKPYLWQLKRSQTSVESSPP